MTVLNNIGSGFNRSTINSNFDIIEDELSNDVLKRDNPSTDNSMKVPLDMNNNPIYNLPAPVSKASPIRLSDLEAAVLEIEKGDVPPPLDRVKENFTLFTGQTTVTFTDILASSCSVYITGTGTDSSKLHEGADYIVTGLFTIELLTSYAEGTELYVYSFGLNVLTNRNAAPSTSIYNLKSLLQETYDRNIGIGVWAHRGLKGYAPENTLAGIYNSLSKGHTAVEGDITWTSDNAAIIMHDTTVNRTTDGTGNVADLTLAQIKALDAGSWFSSIFKGEEVPTFVEWFDAIISQGGIPTIEIKEGGNATQANIQGLASLCVTKRPDNRYMYLVRNPTTFGWIREINPSANMIYFPNTGEPSTLNAEFVETQGNCSLHLDAEYVTAFNFSIYTFPITALNEPNTQDLREASARGFSMIGTDNYIGSNL
jgi:glycerophosphoryl diester phosphodiesterase